jgi:YggT family protein
MRLVVSYASILVTILQLAILLRVLLTWFPMGQDNALVRILNEITEPILGPLRRVVPRAGRLDLTPTAGILVLFVIQLVLARLG